MTDQNIDKINSKSKSNTPIQVVDGLPKHWEVKKLGEVCEKITNGANAKQFDENIGLPITRIETIWNQQIDINRVKYIKENDKEFIDKYSLKHNDILFSHINSDIHLGKTAIYKSVPIILIHGINLLLIRTNNLINPVFFNYYLNFLRARGAFISIAQKSVNQSSINQSKLKNVDIVIPPLPEQQAIVAKIEELLSELDNGKQQLLTAQQQLKVYRQSLLKWAFEGKLCRNYDASDLDDDHDKMDHQENQANHNNHSSDKGELPKGWKWVSIVDIVEQNKHSLKAGPFGSSLKKEFYVKEGYKIYGQEQVIIDDAFFGVYYINQEKYEELKSCRVKPMDILISLVGTVGKVLILPPNCQEGVINPRLIKISLNREVYLHKFFKYYFESSYVKNFYSGKAQGTTMDVLNLGIIKTIPFPLPSLKEQELIVSELESKLTVCDNIEETISQSLLQAETLRQSILKQAFEGKLVNSKD